MREQITFSTCKFNSIANHVNINIIDLLNFPYGLICTRAHFVTSIFTKANHRISSTMRAEH